MCQGSLRSSAIRWSLGLVLAWAILVVPAAATTIVYRTDAELVAISDRIVRGLVVDVRSAPIPGGGVRTLSRIAVLEDLTGGGDALVEVVELGGALASGGMWVPGAARFVVGQHVLVCLEAADGRLRPVAMAFSAFTVADAGAGGAPLARFPGEYALVGVPANGVAAARTLDGFRQIVSVVKGVAATQPMAPAAAAALVAQARSAAAATGRVDEAFTLLGGGIRWREVDNGQTIAWYRNSNWPSPLTGADTDQQMQVAMTAWTSPAAAAITLAYGGTRADGGPATQQYCTPVNSGVGLVTFGDPGNQLSTGTLAIGGGCYSFETSVASGQTFNSFINAYVIFNDGAAIAGFTTTPNFTRVLIHEVGHGIGLGHSTDTGAIMYPSCCGSSSPVPPAIGVDDQDGVAFIYPGGTGPTCTYTVVPTSRNIAAGSTTGTITVTASSASCAWVATSGASWVAIASGASGTGNGTVGYTAAANPAPSIRTGVMTVAGQSVTLTQAAAPCQFTVSPTAVAYGAAGGSGAITVSASAASCAWTATSADAWITVTSGATGTGTGQAGYTVASNIGGGVRTSTLTVAGISAVISQGADADTDGDLLPDAWETLYGLDPNSAAGNDGASGDPDGDGASNSQELGQSTHPRGFATRYLAEGVVNAFFDTEIAVLNPTTTPAIALLRVQPEGAAERSLRLEVPALARRTILGSTLATLTSAAFATVVESDQALVVDRTMRWDGRRYGAHAETAVPSAAATWYLAEGSTSGDFALFYLLQNPGTTTVQATVTFLRPAPQPPIVRSYSLPPQSRTTIPVDTLGPELASTDVSGVVNASLPIIVERAMYLNRPDQPFAAGHESAGVTAPATEWFLAEGATGSFFELFVLIANPSSTAASVAIDYLLPDGSTLAKTYAVAGNSRFTIWVDDEQFPAGSGNRALANASMAMRVRSTNGVPIVVERAMWWPQPNWYEAHHAPGLTVTGTRWALAAGETGGTDGAETYVLIANTSATAGQARVTLYFEDGLNAQQTLSLPANSRTNVPVRALFPLALNRRFGTIVESTGASPVQLVVERAMYASPGGVLWAAGTAAVATRLAP